MKSKAVSLFRVEFDGRKTWDSQPGNTYLVIGKTTDGKRFRQEYGSWYWARGVNLLNGRKYLVRGGKRYLIESVGYTEKRGTCSYNW